MDENVNPEQGNENPEPNNPEAAFEAYLARQAAGADASDADTPNDQGAREGQPDAPADDAAAGAPEQRFKVKVNGEERDIPLSELVKGYQLESDYRVKTSQVAEQSRAAQAQFQQAQQLQAHYAQQLQVYQQQLAQMQPAPPDPALIDADPVGYLRQQRAFEGWQAQMRQAHAESQQLQANQAAQAQHFAQTRLAEQADLLAKALPDFADPEKGQAVRAQVAQFLQKSGFSEQEYAAITDHRAVMLAHKAMLYDQMIAKAAKATDKVANLPPKAPQRPGTGNVSPLDGRTRSMQALKRSGSVEDAANAFAALLGAR